MASCIFDLGTFLKNPTWADLAACRKENLFSLAAHFKMNVSKQMLKRELKSLITEKLVEEGLLRLPALPSSPGSPQGPADGQLKPAGAEGGEEMPGSSQQGGKVDISPGFDTPSRTHSLIKVRLARLQMEAQDKAQARQAEFELRRLELAAETERALKLRELELNLEADKEIRLRKLELQTSVTGTTTLPIPTINTASQSVSGFQSSAESMSVPMPAVGTGSFDVSKHIVLVPPFREAEVVRELVLMEEFKNVYLSVLDCTLMNKKLRH